MSNFTFCYYTQDEGRILAISANSEEEDSSFNNVTEISNNEEKSDELIAQESSTGIPTSLIRKKALSIPSV